MLTQVRGQSYLNGYDKPPCNLEIAYNRRVLMCHLFKVENVGFWLSPSGIDAEPPSPFPSAFVFKFGPGSPPAHPDFYPSIKRSELLCKNFWRVVEPFIKVLHRPKFAKDLEQYRRQSHPFQSDFEALLFSIHALSIAVLPSTVVQQSFHESKDVMLAKFELEAQKALSRADCLKSRSTLCFQALLYYVVSNLRVLFSKVLLVKLT